MFIEDDLFKTEIPLVNVSLGKYAKEIINWLDLPDESSEFITDGINKIHLDAKFKDILWSELILNLVPSWNKKGAKLIHKKVRYLISILLLTCNPLHLEKVMQLLNYKKKPSFRKLYLMPLQQVGFITMLYPDRPNDPNQKYVITEKGKLFLAEKND